MKSRGSYVCLNFTLILFLLYWISVHFFFFFFTKGDRKTLTNILKRQSVRHMLICINFSCTYLCKQSLLKEINFYSVFHAKRGHWVFMMNKRNGTNTVIFVKKEKPALYWPCFLILMLCLGTIVGRRLMVGWCSQWVGLSDSTSVLSAFLWLWKWNRL